MLHSFLCAYSVSQSCPILCDPMDCSPPGSSVQGILQARALEWVPFPSPGDLPDPGIEPTSPSLEVDSLPSEPPEKLENTGVDCLSLLPGIFPTQGLNPGLPHSRWILYHLSHQGRPPANSLFLSPAPFKQLTPGTPRVISAASAPGGT